MLQGTSRFWRLADLAGQNWRPCGFKIATEREAIALPDDAVSNPNHKSSRNRKRFAVVCIDSKIITLVVQSGLIKRKWDDLNRVSRLFQCGQQSTGGNNASDH